MRKRAKRRAEEKLQQPIRSELSVEGEAKGYEDIPCCRSRAGLEGVERKSESSRHRIVEGARFAWEVVERIVVGDGSIEGEEEELESSAVEEEEEDLDDFQIEGTSKLVADTVE